MLRDGKEVSSASQTEKSGIKRDNSLVSGKNSSLDPFLRG